VDFVFCSSCQQQYDRVFLVLSVCLCVCLSVEVTLAAVVLHRSRTQPQLTVIGQTGAGHAHSGHSHSSTQRMDTHSTPTNPSCKYLIVSSLTNVAQNSFFAIYSLFKLSCLKDDMQRYKQKINVKVFLAAYCNISTSVSVINLMNYTTKC